MITYEMNAPETPHIITFYNIIANTPWYFYSCNPVTMELASGRRIGNRTSHGNGGYR